MADWWQKALRKFRDLIPWWITFALSGLLLLMIIMLVKLLHLLTTAHWYRSIFFWTVSGVVIVLLVGTVGMWVTYLTSRSRLELVYDVVNVTSEYVGEDLKSVRRYQPLAEPLVLQIRLANRQRKDVASTSFDQARPIVIDVGIPIVTLLDRSATTQTSRGVSRPGVIASRPPLVIVLDRTALKIGPCLIGALYEERITILADGTAPRLYCQSPVLNVKLQRRRDSTQKGSPIDTAWVRTTSPGPWAGPWASQRPRTIQETWARDRQKPGSRTRR